MPVIPAFKGRSQKDQGNPQSELEASLSFLAGQPTHKSFKISIVPADSEGDADVKPGLKSWKTVNLEPLTMEDIISG